MKIKNIKITMKRTKAEPSSGHKGGGSKTPRTPTKTTLAKRSTAGNTVALRSNTKASTCTADACDNPIAGADGQCTETQVPGYSIATLRTSSRTGYAIAGADVQCIGTQAPYHSSASLCMSSKIGYAIGRTLVPLGEGRIGYATETGSSNMGRASRAKEAAATKMPAPSGAGGEGGSGRARRKRKAEQQRHDERIGKKRVGGAGGKDDKEMGGGAGGGGEPKRGTRTTGEATKGRVAEKGNGGGGDEKSTQKFHDCLRVGDTVPTAGVFRARCGRALGRSELFKLCLERIGVVGMRVWLGGRRPNPAFKKGETVAYFAKGQGGRIESGATTFEYGTDISTAYYINTTIQGQDEGGVKQRRNNLKLANRANKTEGGVDYWAAIATRPIKYGEMLRIPYRDREHIKKIKAEIQGKAKGKKPLSKGQEAAMVKRKAERERRAALAERHREKKRERSRKRQEEREQRRQKPQRQSERHGARKKEGGGGIAEVNSRQNTQL